MPIGIGSSSAIAFSVLMNCIVKESCYPVEKPVVTPPSIVVEKVLEKEEPIEKIQVFDPLQVSQFAVLPKEVKLSVPFTSQAPHKNWGSPYNEACEEASLAMIEFYLRESELSTNSADTEIKYLVSLEDRKGWGADISAQQVATLTAQTYRRNYKIYTGADVTVANMKSLLAKGYPLIIPVAGRDLGNPHFQGSGPPYHMVVLTGYSDGIFYTHDPGTQHGEHYKYSQETIQNAIHEWTGKRETINEGGKSMLVIEDARLNTHYVADYSF